MHCGFRRTRGARSNTGKATGGGGWLGTASIQRNPHPTNPGGSDAGRARCCIYPRRVRFYGLRRWRGVGREGLFARRVFFEYRSRSIARVMVAAGRAYFMQDMQHMQHMKEMQDVKHMKALS